VRRAGKPRTNGKPQVIWKPEQGVLLFRFMSDKRMRMRTARLGKAAGREIRGGTNDGVPRGKFRLKTMSTGLGSLDGWSRDGQGGGCTGCPRVGT